MVKNNRITVPALKHYVPIFQIGDIAEEYLLENADTVDMVERNQLETAMRLKELALKRIIELSMPLITREINKIISKSHLKNDDDNSLFNILFYAGIDGMRRGLRKFDVEKMNNSSTNYLFQWLTTYAKKELVSLESPFGIPPSRFVKYKKISAVRKKLTEMNGKYASNEEVLEYFHSGKADIKNMNGRVGSSDKPSQDNLNMTMELVVEQENFEKSFMNVDLMDPLEDYSTDVKMTVQEKIHFDETIFGVFLTTCAFKEEAKVVLMSELGSTSMSLDQRRVLDSITPSEYRKISGKWKNLIKDVNGPFYSFLSENRGLFEQFDINETMRDIENLSNDISSKTYSDLFLS